jgi:hypothetical protein
MTLPVYPGHDLLKGLTLDQKWTPEPFVKIAETATGARIGVGLTQYPLHTFELAYEFLRDGTQWGHGGYARPTLEFKTLMGFYLSVGGPLGRFLYKNPDDNHVSLQPIGVGDDITTTFTLVRTLGANGTGAGEAFAVAEPIGQVDPNQPFVLYVNGAAVDPSKYALNTASPVANTVTLNTPAPLGQKVQVDMGFYYYVMFDEGTTITFEKFMDRLWQLQKVTLRTCRPGA